MTVVIDKLAALGFTETEALIYCELLGNSPATGYRLAQAAGKAPANTYQALSALVQKGAAMVDEGDGKHFRAVPPTELLGTLARAFEARSAAAAAALEKLATPAEDDRIYQLRSPDQVIQRALRMIAQASEIVLFDLFPEPFSTLQPALELAAARGVAVAGIVYDEACSDAAPMVLARGSHYVRERWPGNQISVVTDAREHIIALLSHDGAAVLHGIWSESAWLACMHHNGLASEIQLLATPSAREGPLADLSLIRAAPAGLRNILDAERGAMVGGGIA